MICSPTTAGLAAGRGVCAVLALAALGCSGEPEPAGPAVDAEPYRTVGSGVARARIDGSQVGYRQLLEEAESEAQLRLATPGLAPQQERVQLFRLAAARERLQRLELAHLEYRERLAEATSSLQDFLDRFAPRRNWELSYAIEAGDLGLAVSVLEDTAARALGESKGSSRRMPESEARFSRGSGTEQVAAAPELEEGVRRLASTSFYRLGELAVERLEYGAAERSFRRAIEYAADLGARAEAMRAYADLLEGMGREEDSRRVAAELDRLLRLE